MRTFLIILFVLILASPSFALFVVPSKPKETKEPPAPAETKPADVKPVNTKPPEEKPKAVKRIDTMIAVFDLEITEGVTKGISRPLSESIRREIVMSGRYEVIDRGNMNKILGEQKFQLSGCASGECIVEAGQLLGVGKIITGSVSLVGKTYYLSLSLINVETGKIEDVSEDECKCEVDDLIKSSKRLVKKLLGETVSETVQTAKTEIKTETTKTYPSASPLAKGGSKGGDFTDSSGIEMVFVKGGCYQMGDTYGEGNPVHEVCVDDFYIGKYEVTVGAFRKFVDDSGYSTEAEKGDGCVWKWKKDSSKDWRDPGFAQNDSHPVACISWNDAIAFTEWLTNKTGKSYRLPTEAEWEYAAKSGGKSDKWAGTRNESNLGDYAWYAKNSGGKTHPVGQKKPNGLGIYDMSGNVREWCNDWYDSEYYKNSPKDNPKGPNSGSYRVERGGGWIDIARNVRASSRSSPAPDHRYSELGLRLAVPVR